MANRGEIAVQSDPRLPRAGHRRRSPCSPTPTARRSTCSWPTRRTRSDRRRRPRAISPSTSWCRVAKASGADAVHPGYGFLAENAAFAEACGAAGLVFIGPPPAAIRAPRRQDGRATDRAHAGRADGAGHVRARVRRRRRDARGRPRDRLPAHGQGRDGRRRRRGCASSAPRASWWPRSALARSEAAYAFGDGAVYLERYLAEPRHIEVQVLADAHGHVVHLGERECSIQRRHQKLVEEAPSPFVDGPRCASAWARPRAGSPTPPATSTPGTVEFLVDADRSFYFLEMNTRLQVEHPVTEMVTGIDLVREQLRIAAGEPLEPHAGRRRPCAARRSSAGSTPRIRSAAGCRRRARITGLRAADRPVGARRLGRLRGLHGSALLRHAAREARWCGASTARPPSAGWRARSSEYKVVGVL